MPNNFSSHKIKDVNKHIILDDGQGLLIDTGCPISFHTSGRIRIGEEEITVPTSVMGVSDEYLTQKIGADVRGIIGTDIINSHPTLISLKDRLLLFNDDAVYSERLQQAIPSHELGGLISVEIDVNGKAAKMIVDTGAKISYIKEAFLIGMTEEGEDEDFSPFIGDFRTVLYGCSVDLRIGTGYRQLFGVMPSLVTLLLEPLGIDGIIGFDLFKIYRLQLRDGVVFYPPQGI